MGRIDFGYRTLSKIPAYYTQQTITAVKSYDEHQYHVQVVKSNDKLYKPDLIIVVDN